MAQAQSRNSPAAKLAHRHRYSRPVRRPVRLGPRAVPAVPEEQPGPTEGRPGGLPGPPARTGPRPAVGDEQTTAQLAACARVWEQTGEDGSGLARERRWRYFPRLLVVLVGTAAAGVRGAVADLRLAAEENPTVAELLAAVPAGAARIEDLVQRGPSAPI